LKAQPAMKLTHKENRLRHLKWLFKHGSRHFLLRRSTDRSSTSISDNNANFYRVTSFYLPQKTHK